MIEKFLTLVPNEFLGLSGKVFYSGRDAFSAAASNSLYILGFNPGGSGETHAEETVQRHCDGVLNKYPSNWSAYRDESWLGFPPGSATFQPVILELLSNLNLDPGLVPASNLIFLRSEAADKVPNKRTLIELCWKFHAAIIDELKPRYVLALGNETGSIVRKNVDANALVASFTEPNNRRWESTAHKSENGLVVFSLTHPGRAKWTTFATDPRPMVRSIYSNYR